MRRDLFHVVRVVVHESTQPDFAYLGRPLEHDTTCKTRNRTHLATPEIEVPSGMPVGENLETPSGLPELQ
jgi:hypothetical protein